MGMLNYGDKECSFKNRALAFESLSFDDEFVHQLCEYTFHRHCVPNRTQFAYHMVLSSCIYDSIFKSSTSIILFGSYSGRRVYHPHLRRHFFIGIFGP